MEMAMMPILQGSGKDTGDPVRIFPGAHSNLQNLSKFSKVRTLHVLHGSPPDGLPSPHVDGCTHLPQGRKDHYLEVSWCSLELLEHPWQRLWSLYFRRSMKSPPPGPQTWCKTALLETSHGGGYGGGDQSYGLCWQVTKHLCNYWKNSRASLCPLVPIIRSGLRSTLK